MTRNRIIVVGALIVGIAACRDMGLEGNIPLDQAMAAPPPELVAQVHARSDSTAEFVADGRLWVPAGGPVRLDADALRPVGAAAGRSIHARAWDQPPYEALFTPAQDGAVGALWQAWEPVRGGIGPAVDGGAPAH